VSFIAATIDKRGDKQNARASSEKDNTRALKTRACDALVKGAPVWLSV